MKKQQASRPGFPPAVHFSMAQLRNLAGGPTRQFGEGSGCHSGRAISNGFTLIELLAVIAILAILAALFMDAGLSQKGTYGVWVGEAGFMPSPVHPPSIFKEINNPARSVNVVFVDGHVEMRRIGDIPTDFSDPFWRKRD